MIPEHRLDRAERLLILIIKAGDRERRAWRQRSREQNEKLNILINSHIRHEDQMIRHEDQMNEHEARLINSRREQEALLINSRREHEALLINSRREQEELLIKSRREYEELLINSRREYEEEMKELRAAMRAGQDRIDKAIAKVSEQQDRTERSLQAFIDSLRKGRNGGDSI